jgi:hypothetical protein
MSQKDVDKGEAKEILLTEWSRIQDESQTEYIDDPIIKQKISEVLEGPQLTYRYILMTSILGKAVNPDVHSRSMQSGSNLDGSFNARSLAHKVVVPWEKENGERLGGSNEPYLNKPARHPEWSLDVPARSTSARERLYNLLQRLEEKTNSGEIDPMDVLRQALQTFYELEPKLIEFESPDDAPYHIIEGAIIEYLTESGGGERLAAVMAACFQAKYDYAGNGEWDVKADNANVPDSFSDEAGDVELYRNGHLKKAAEVKDKPTTRSDIQHVVTKAQQHELDEYLYIVGADFDLGAEEAAREEAENAPVSIHLVYPDEILALLKLVDDEQRVNFIDYVGEYLNDMRASDESKAAYQEVVDVL